MLPDTEWIQGSLYDYGGEGKGKRPDVYFSPHESLFRFTRQGDDHDHNERSKNGDGGVGGVGGGKLCGEGPSGTTNSKPFEGETGEQPSQDGEWKSFSSKGALNGSHHHQHQLHFSVMYAGKSFDPRRMCGGCTEELRAAIVSSGHDLEVWHTLDHERRALVTAQRQNDVLKARWAQRERKERQVRQSEA